jgi:hypothetical protein
MRSRAGPRTVGVRFADAPKGMMTFFVSPPTPPWMAQETGRMPRSSSAFGMSESSRSASW